MKIPSKPGATPPIAPDANSESVRGTARGPRFDSSLPSMKGPARGAPSASTGATGAASAAGPERSPALRRLLVEVASDMRRGAVGREGALQRLVERTVAQRGEGLTAAQREALTKLLNGVLSDDPGLLAHAKGLGSDE